jgi:site-specific recombinase XerD
MRRISLDSATVAGLTEHRQRYEELVRQVAVEPTNEAFLFSYELAHDWPYDPSEVSHRDARMCAEIGVDSHLHALRHYSATELLTAGVDLRTVAGRLGHGGGGATTLRVYGAWSASPTVEPPRSSAAV